MFRRLPLVVLLVLAVAGACTAPGGSPSPSGPVSPTPSLASPTPSPLKPSLSPSPSPSPTVVPVTPSPTVPSPSPSPTAPATMIVRAYFLLDDAARGDPALVPVLRTVPESPATATAAMTQLLAGPSAKERSASPRITTLIPAGTKLLGIEISGGLATVDLSGDFASGGGTFLVRGRLAQVTYTLTQFTAVDGVSFKLDGRPVTVFSSEGLILDKPLTRADFRDDFLPPIFVDRPAWGASLLNPGQVTGLANVFEAQFRIAVLDQDSNVLVDDAVQASCGTGCWGRFEATLSYDVSVAQWGTLRVWDISEGNGEALAVRDYPVYLRPLP